MLKSNFFTYSITHLDDYSLKAQIKLNENHDIYTGHFPGMPVTPGVCQVQIMKEVLNAALEKEYMLLEAKDIKFMNLIDPRVNSVFELDLTIKHLEDSRLGINGVIQSNEKVFFKMRSVFINS